MSNYFEIFIGASIAAFAGGIIAGLFGLIKSLGGMKKSVDHLIVADKAQTQSIQVIASLQRPLMAAHKATLEALRDGRCNGNVTDAHTGIVEAFKEYDDYLIGRVGT